MVIISPSYRINIAFPKTLGGRDLQGLWLISALDITDITLFFYPQIVGLASNAIEVMLALGLDALASVKGKLSNSRNII